MRATPLQTAGKQFRTGVAELLPSPGVIVFTIVIAIIIGLLHVFFSK